MNDTASEGLRKTPLDALHRALGGKMVPFAGYDMPVQYPSGVLQEHLHCRAKAGLFDVSHMGQVTLRGPAVVAALERLVPGDIAALPIGGLRYTMLTAETGGILDDLMVGQAGDHLSLVVNAACKEADLAHLRASLPATIAVELAQDRALLALQGPAAASVLAKLAPDSAAMRFMSFRAMSVGGIPCSVARSGYTGEDGFEISVPSDRAEDLARRLLDDPAVAPIGLGARDSLRLEAGLCLYGADIDRSTTPIEAGLNWTISRRRRQAGGFQGEAAILRQLTEGPTRQRVGIQPLDKAPARGHTVVTDDHGLPIGEITSGGFGPSVGGPVAMGYVAASHVAIGSTVQLLVRGTPRPARIVALPFVAHRYCRPA